MKFTTILSLTALLATSAYAGPSEVEQTAKAVADFCKGPTGSCTKLKRAADAAAAALAAPEARKIIHYCHLPGQGCSKAKRSLEALEDAVKAAYAAADISDDGEFALPPAPFFCSNSKKLTLQSQSQTTSATPPASPATR